MSLKQVFSADYYCSGMRVVFRIGIAGKCFNSVYEGRIWLVLLRMDDECSFKAIYTVKINNDYCFVFLYKSFYTIWHQSLLSLFFVQDVMLIIFCMFLYCYSLYIFTKSTKFSHM